MSNINRKSLLITLVVVAVAVFVTDFLIHGVWLTSTYKATASLWRPEAEMQQHFPWMLLGQFIIAAAFTLIYAACVAEKRCLSCTIKYAVCMGLFAGGGQLIMYSVEPYPGVLVAKWFAAGIVQAVILGLVVFKVYKPLAA